MGEHEGNKFDKFVVTMNSKTWRTIKILCLFVGVLALVVGTLLIVINPKPVYPNNFTLSASGIKKLDSADNIYQLVITKPTTTVTVLPDTQTATALVKWTTASTRIFSVIPSTVSNGTAIITLHKNETSYGILGGFYHFTAPGEAEFPYRITVTCGEIVKYIDIRIQLMEEDFNITATLQKRERASENDAWTAWGNVASLNQRQAIEQPHLYEYRIYAELFIYGTKVYDTIRDKSPFFYEDTLMGGYIMKLNINNLRQNTLTGTEIVTPSITDKIDLQGNWEDDLPSETTDPTAEFNRYTLLYMRLGCKFNQTPYYMSSMFTIKIVGEPTY